MFFLILEMNARSVLKWVQPLDLLPCRVCGAAPESLEKIKTNVDRKKALVSRLFLYMQTK